MLNHCFNMKRTLVQFTSYTVFEYLMTQINVITHFMTMSSIFCNNSVGMYLLSMVIVIGINLGVVRIFCE